MWRRLKERIEIQGRKSVTKYFIDKLRCMFFDQNNILNIKIVAGSDVIEVTGFLEGVEEKENETF